MEDGGTSNPEGKEQRPCDSQARVKRLLLLSLHLNLE